MASAKDNNSFTNDVFGSYPLDNAVDWIGHNLSPDEVFSEDDLSEWALKNDFVRAE